MAASRLVAYFVSLLIHTDFARGVSRVALLFRSISYRPVGKDDDAGTERLRSAVFQGLQSTFLLLAVSSGKAVH